MTYPAIIASIVIVCVVVIALCFRKVLRLSPKEVWIITHHRRGELGIDTFSKILIVPSWFFALLFVAAVMLMSFLLSWWALL